METNTAETLLLQLRSLLTRVRVSAVRIGYDRNDEYLIPDINGALEDIDSFFLLEEPTQPAIEIPFDADDYNGRGVL